MRAQRRPANVFTEPAVSDEADAAITTSSIVLITEASAEAKGLEVVTLGDVDPYKSYQDHLPPPEEEDSDDEGARGGGGAGCAQS